MEDLLYIAYNQNTQDNIVWLDFLYCVIKNTGSTDNLRAVLYICCVCKFISNMQVLLLLFFIFGYSMHEVIKKPNKVSFVCSVRAQKLI